MKDVMYTIIFFLAIRKGRGGCNKSNADKAEIYEKGMELELAAACLSEINSDLLDIVTLP